MIKVDLHAKNQSQTDGWTDGQTGATKRVISFPSQSKVDFATPPHDYFNEMGTYFL